MAAEVPHGEVTSPAAHASSNAVAVGTAGAGAADGTGTDATDSCVSIVPSRFYDYKFDVVQHSGAKTTGWRVWNSAFVMLRYLESPAQMLAAAGRPAPDADADTDTGAAPAVATSAAAIAARAARGMRVLDLSAGTGMVGVACALLGATVVATDIDAQMELLQRNVDRCAARLKAAGDEGAGGSIEAVEFAWGDDTSALGMFDTILCSDSLYISVRDSIQGLLLGCLRDLVDNNLKAGGKLLFAFEERLVVQETEAVDQLRAMVRVDEVPEESLDVSDAKLEDDESGLDGLFWEPPPVRLLILSPLADTTTASAGSAGGTGGGGDGDGNGGTVR